MTGQGFEAWHPLERLAVRGMWRFSGTIEISGIRRDLKRRSLADPPDVFIGVDAPDFNLVLEKSLKQHGIPTVHYVSPSIWAWRGKRIHKIGAAVSRVLALFPFEPVLYEKQGIPVSMSVILWRTCCRSRMEEAKRGSFSDCPISSRFLHWVARSRQSELQYMAETFIETARVINKSLPEALFLVPLATRETRLLF